MKTILMADPVRFPRMTTQELRDTFLIDRLYQPGRIELAYVDLDRAVVGIAAPADRPILLPTSPELRAKYFTERRELGVLNAGGPGVVNVDGISYELHNLDVLYIGRGNADVRFESAAKESPAVFYLLSYPAHTSYPVTLIKSGDAQPLELGDARTCNKRTVYKVYPRRWGAELSAGDGSNASARRQHVEHHAGAHAYAALGSVFLF
jgi:4-deoxy-L-threo-5-hexosulose-uronate ketol-isomerase